MLDCAEASSEQVFGLPWGIDQESVRQGIGPPLAEGVRPSRSLALIPIETQLAGFDVKIFLTCCEDEGLSDVSLTPKRLVIGAYGSLVDRFGQPQVAFDVGQDSYWVWNGDGFQVQLAEPPMGPVSVTFRPGVLEAHTEVIADE